MPHITNEIHEWIERVAHVLVDNAGRHHWEACHRRRRRPAAGTPPPRRRGRLLRRIGREGGGGRRRRRGGGRVPHRGGRDRRGHPVVHVPRGSVPVPIPRHFRCLLAKTAREQFLHVEPS